MTALVASRVVELGYWNSTGEPTEVGGAVRAGPIRPGDRLEAIGSSRATGTVVDVRVRGIPKPAEVGEPALIRLSWLPNQPPPNPKTAFYALVDPGVGEQATTFRARVAWASHRNADPPGTGDSVGAGISGDTAVSLRFGLIERPATLLLTHLSAPLAGTQIHTLRLDQSWPLVADFPFRMNIHGDFAATGIVLGNR